MEGIGKARGKLILAGEHAVVYNRPAIALPFLSASIETHITESKDMILNCVLYQGLLSEVPSNLLSLKKLVAETLKEIDKVNDVFMITIYSDIPIGSGLGSSASVATSVVRAIYHYYHLDLSDEALSKLVFIAEKINHQNPSGLDSTTVIHEKTIHFQKDKGMIVLQANLDAIFIVADSGLNGNTKEAVMAVKDKLDSDHQGVMQTMDAIALVSSEMSIALQENNVYRIGNLMDENHQHLVNLGVSNEILDHLVVIAKQAGALGAKLTGSGKGGCILALSDNLDTAQKIANALEKAGARQTWLMNLKDE